MPTNPRSRLRAFLLTILALIAIPLALDRCFPLPLPDLARDGATVVLARDGTPLRAFADADGVWRYPVERSEVSTPRMRTGGRAKGYSDSIDDRMSSDRSRLV